MNTPPEGTRRPVRPMRWRSGGNTCAECGAPIVDVATRCRSHAQRMRHQASYTDDVRMLTLHYEHGMSYRAIARLFDVSHQRVFQRVQRAVAALPELEKRRLWGDR